MVVAGILARPPPPHIPGAERVARVLATGAEVDGLQVGDLVVLPLYAGAWRERLVVPADGLFALPAAATSSSTRCLDRERVRTEQGGAAIFGLRCPIAQLQRQLAVARRAPGESRTRNSRILSPSPLPLGYWGPTENSTSSSSSQAARPSESYGSWRTSPHTSQAQRAACCGSLSIWKSCEC